VSERMREDHAKLGLAAHDGAVRVDVDRLQNTVINRAGAGGPEGARRPERQSVSDAADAGKGPRCPAAIVTFAAIQALDRRSIAPR
jgi:hypothetical protein